MPVPGPRPRPANGKGDDVRPLSVDAEVFRSNWDRIFGKKEEPKPDPCAGCDCETPCAPKAE